MSAVATPPDYLAESTAVFEAVQSAADIAADEREFHTTVDALLAGFAKKCDLQLLYRREYTIANGRADAVYNRFIIEYEKPGRLRSTLSHGPTKHAVDQVKAYIESVAQVEGHDVKSLLGLAFDGRWAIFVQYHDKEWIVEPPEAWSDRVALRLLRSIASLSRGRALTPLNVIEDFGLENIRTHRVLKSLYDALERAERPLVGVLFQQWRLLFSEVSGYAESSHARITKELRPVIRALGLQSRSISASKILFILHTYFALIAKLIARLVFDERIQTGHESAPSLAHLAQLPADMLRNEMLHIEDGTVFRDQGVTNLVETDFFSWYLSLWTQDVAKQMSELLNRLADYNPHTLSVAPTAARDLLKKLYHYLLPRTVRHDLGEYYTPDWLAQETLEFLDEPLFRLDNDTSASIVEKRVLDPACGSGTFLALAIRAIRKNCAAAGWASEEILALILRCVVGMDLNPLAVTASRVTYLLAIADLLPYEADPITVPVFMADTVLGPRISTDLFAQNRRFVDTVVGRFSLPATLESRNVLQSLCDLFRTSIVAGTEPSIIGVKLKLAPFDCFSDDDRTICMELFQRLQQLHAQDLDGLWAKLIENLFTPVLLGRFHYVVGNPPWINWQSLPQEYRDSTVPVWKFYDIFPHKGFSAILGKSRDDIAVLFLYVSADRFLAQNGTLAMVVPIGLFKNTGGGKGFRKLTLPDKSSLRITAVQDFSRLQLFEGASNKAAVIVLKRDEKTKYPVPFTVWLKKGKKSRFNYDSLAGDVLSSTERLDLDALPVSASDPTSAWLTAERQALPAIRKALGHSYYKAHAGVFTGGANAVFWLDITAKNNDGTVLVHNIVEGAKRKVAPINTILEEDLVYPLVRQRDVSRWHVSPSASILLTHLEGQRLKAIPVDDLKAQYPHTLAYLRRYEEFLADRAAFKRYFTRADKNITAPFYSLFDIGDYTFAPFKVIWNSIASDINAAVLEGRAVPQHIVSLIALSRREEAYYVAAVMNSLPFRCAAIAYSQAGGKSFGNPHLLEHIAVPRFDESDRNHQSFAAAGIEAAAGHRAESIQKRIDSAAAKLWGISDAEMTALRNSLLKLRAISDPQQE